MGELSLQWNRVIEWCVAHAPTTVAEVNPPADHAAIGRIERSTGQSWSPELRTWFTLHNGSDQGFAFPQVIPGFRPLTLDELHEDWTSLTGIWRSTTEEFGGAALMSEPAGTTAFTFIPSYVPIAADDSRDLVVVDTRGGDHHGCVVVFAGESVDDGTNRWPSLSAMLAEVADALETTSPFRGWVPYVEDGTLFWDYP